MMESIPVTMSVKNCSLSDASRSNTVITYIKVILISSIFFQKFSFPGTSGVIPLVLPILLLATLAGLWRGDLLISRTSVFLFSIFGGIGCFSSIFCKENTISSLAYVVACQSVLVTSVRQDFKISDVFDFYCNSMFLVSVLAVIQYFSQFVINREYSFFLDYNLPQEIYLKGFNNLNPLDWDSPIIKSNGVFFPEPSIFNQFLSLAVFFEIIKRQRPLYLLCYLMGLLVSYSGTGVVMLFIVLPIYLIFRASFKSFIYCTALLVFVTIFLQFIDSEFLTKRVTEVFLPNTSAHARFIAIFWVIERQLDFGVFPTFFGVGPGQIIPQDVFAPFQITDPTWGKIFFEYGALGFIIYIFYFLSFCRNTPFFICLSLGVVYFFMGGYIAYAPIISLLVVFLAWTPKQSDNFNASNGTD
ncbi:hypothetical protein FOHLNKBM_0170 [Methylobacterium longum]|nr:hypothetical protein FOHLNKBM_0170 [Methylobacterium longum]